jgi:hypothetical protein
VHAAGDSKWDDDPLAKITLAARLKRKVVRLVAVELDLAKLIGRQARCDNVHRVSRHGDGRIK